MQSSNCVQVSPCSLQCPGSTGQDGFPAAPGMEKGRGRERTWSRVGSAPGRQRSPAEGIAAALDGSAGLSLLLNLPCRGWVMNKGANTPNPAPRVLLCGKNGWSGCWGEATLVQHRSAVPGSKETEKWFCEGHFSFVRAQGEGAGELLN